MMPRQIVLLTLAACLLPHATAADQDKEDLLALKAEIESSLQPDDDIDLLYLEYPLANIGTQEEDWSAYHSGIAFKEKKTGMAWTIDYRPRDPEHLMNFIRPLVYYKGQWPFWDVEIDWKNEAYVAWGKQIDSRFTNTTLIGRCKASMLKPLIDYTIDFGNKNNMFQPISVVQNLTRTIIKSTTCHDYVQGAIHSLFDAGAEFKQDKKSMVFRDAVLIFADKEPTPIDVSTLPGFLSVLVYFRYFSYFVPAINKNFIHARAYLNEGHSSDVRFILHSENTYLRLFLRYPFIDYCYTTIHLPRRGKEDSDLVNRFRHCKFTKAKFPDRAEGKNKISDPLSKAFSSTLGWARESAILLIPAALKVSPQLAYGVLLACGLVLLTVLVAIVKIGYTIFKKCCGCSQSTFFVLTLIWGVSLALILSPLTIPLEDREANNVRVWGCRACKDMSLQPIQGVYSVNDPLMLMNAVDFSHMEDVVLNESSGSVTGWLPLGGPALSVVSAGQSSNDKGSILNFDGVLFLRLLQIANAKYFVKYNHKDQTLSMYLSLFGSHYLAGSPEKSGDFWQNSLGWAGKLSASNMKSDDGTIEMTLEGNCDNKAVCSGADTVSLGLKMIMGHTGNVIDSNLKGFDQERGPLIVVGVAS